MKLDPRMMLLMMMTMMMMMMMTMMMMMMMVMMMMMMMTMMRRLGPQNTAKFQGAYQVTSPKNLLSILKTGLVPGGEKGKR